MIKINRTENGDSCGREVIILERSIKKTQKRFLFMVIIFTLLFLALITRIFWIQIVNGAQYRRLAGIQSSRSRTLEPLRGLILDRNGNELAVNVPADTIAAYPSSLRESKTDIDSIAGGMSEILGIDKDNLLKKLKSSNEYVVIARKLDKETSEKLKKWISDNKVEGISFEEDTKRFYPQKNLAAQVIGFTGSDNQGLGGLELSLEEYLKGRPGILSGESDAGGREIPFGQKRYIDAKDGLNAVLTIDIFIQNFAEKALQKAMDEYKVLNGGTVIVMDPRSGDILAMVSKPDFDLNTPYDMPTGIQGLTPDIWGGMSSDKRIDTLQKLSWRNKAVNDTYEPGSTFKAITAAAFLEEGIIKPDSKVVDAPIKVGGWTIDSWKSGGHGRETFAESIYRSSNTVFVKLALAIGIDRFYQYLKAFGFYERTGLELPGEASGIIQQNPTEIDMSIASFGQGFQITPIQLITVYAAIENGGELLKPRIIKKLTDTEGNVVISFEPETVRNVISKQTSRTLRTLLEEAVAQGTGANANVEGYRVAGKTGTSETLINNERSKERYISSFSGFAPADNPLISVLVILDHPSEKSHSGGTVAAPVAAEIIDYTLQYLGVERDNSDQENDVLSN